MKKLNKKGFTIVELVIVIAVIAILAAVLIPTFSNVVKKANYSNDIQVCRNMETSLAAENVGNDKVENIVKAKAILTQEGYANNFTPKSSGYRYYWCKVDNYVYLVKDNVVAFPENKTFSSENCYPLDKEYSLVVCDIVNITLDKDALVVGEDNTVTLIGTAIPKTVMISSKVYQVKDDAITIKPTTKETITISQDTTVYISDVAVEPSSAEITYGGTATLVAVFTPTNPTTDTVSWSSSNKEVATVDNTGKVTALKVGTATIKATAKDLLGTYEGSCNVTVVAKNVTTDMIGTIDAQTYTGSEVEPTLTVTDGTTLTKDTDYTVSYTDNINAGTATATITGKGNYTGSASKTFTINKATQSAPTKPTYLSKTTSTITVDTISGGVNGVKYAKSENTTAPTSDNDWQDSTTFNVTAGTTYYFFAKYVGNSNYFESPASASSDAMKINVYNISVTNTNATGAVGNPTTITETATNVSLTFTADTNYKLPDDVTVTGAEKESWTQSTGVLVIGTPTANVSITVTAELNTFKVTFDKQSGTGGTDSVNATYGQAMPSITAPERTGYKFNGYYAGTDGTGTQYYDKDCASTTNCDFTSEKTLYAYWTSAWKSLTATVGGSLVNYYPVLGGTNPNPDAFAYSTDGTTFTEITKTGSEYTMSDVAEYAKAGTLYYTGAVLAVRSVNGISWNNTFNDNSGESYPYRASTNTDDLQDGFKGYLTTGETVERVLGQDAEIPSPAPTINGVSLTDIWDAYKDGTATGFGGTDGCFWSNYAQSSTNAYYCNCDMFGSWNQASRSSSDGMSVLVSLSFS